jgi:hypothetical protein
MSVAVAIMRRKKSAGDRKLSGSAAGRLTSDFALRRIQSSPGPVRSLDELSAPSAVAVGSSGSSSSKSVKSSSSSSPVSVRSARCGMMW